MRSRSPLCTCYTSVLPHALLQPAGAAQACATPLRWASSVSGCGLYACCEDSMRMRAHQCHALLVSATRHGAGGGAQRGTQREPLSALARRQSASGGSGQCICWQCMRRHARRPPGCNGPRAVPCPNQGHIRSSCRSSESHSRDNLGRQGSWRRRCTAAPTARTRPACSWTPGWCALLHSSLLTFQAHPLKCPSQPSQVCLDARPLAAVTMLPLQALVMIEVPGQAATIDQPEQQVWTQSADSRAGHCARRLLPCGGRRAQGPWVCIRPLRRDQVD